MNLRCLHISDFHIRGGDSYDRDVVFGALVRSVERLREQEGRRPDLIFATGDIGQSGKLEEYAAATAFFDCLLDASKLTRRHLYVVPGNHDIDRDQGDQLEKNAFLLDRAKLQKLTRAGILAYRCREGRAGKS